MNRPLDFAIGPTAEACDHHWLAIVPAMLTHRALMN
jgi:hypothetical protein